MRLLVTLLLATVISFSACADHKDIMSFKSNDGFKPTLERLMEALEKRKLTVFAVIDHAKGARNAGLSMSPSTVVIFGNPKVGTPVMKGNPLAGLDLPLRIVVTEDRGLVQVTYREPETLTRTWYHGQDELPVIAKMAGALRAIALEAADRTE